MVTDAELEAAEARGRALMAEAPRAASAAYDPVSRRLGIELANGCSYGVPVALVQELRGAGDEALAGVQVDGAGFNLHWPALDVDLHVPALVAGVFGTRAWMMREFAREAGQARSPAKADAARRNGAKGGRPRKTA